MNTDLPFIKILSWFAACARLVATVMLLCLATQVRGAALQGMTIHSFSSEYTSGADLRMASSLVTDSGFFGDYYTTAPRSSTWLTLPTTAGAYSNAFVTFDLGSVQTVHQMKVWNYNEGGVQTRRGIQTAHISVAGEDLVFTTNLLNQAFTRAPGVFTNNFAQLIDMNAIQARYVRINVVTNFGGDNRVGLSKVRFINTNTPPTLDLATKNISGNRVTLRFSEPVSPASATNIANYSIQSGPAIASITSAQMHSMSDRVVLETSILDSNLIYTVSAQNVREASGTTSIAPSLVAIDPELVIWLKADAGVTADIDGRVSQWTDQSEAGNHASEIDPAMQPILVNGALNGKPVLRFDGVVGQGMTIPHSTSLVAKGDITFFAVINVQTVTNYNGIISKTAGPATNYPAAFDYHLANGTGKPRLCRGNGSALSTLLGSSNVVIGQNYIVEIVVQGTNAVHYLNGNFNGQAVFTEGIGDTGSTVRIGRREDGTVRLNGDLAEVMLIRGAVSESERLEIDAYLGRKYGILTPNTGVAIITSQPANATSYTGQGATFTVGLTNGALPRTLQWYKAPSTALTGQTNSSLVLTNLTSADDNTAYYMIASNVDGSVQTDTATLTVLPLTPPNITQHPQSQTVYLHQSARFTATVLGPNLAYQWKFNNSAISGATDYSLTIVDASLAKAGNYTVTVTNEYGAVDSNPGVLTVLVPATGSYPAAVLDANPLLYYRFSDINDTNVTFNFGNLGQSHGGTYEGSYTGAAGPRPPTFPIFEETNLAYNDETLTGGGAKFPAISLNTNGGPQVTFAAWVYKDFEQQPFASVFFSRASGQSCGLGVKNNASSQNILEYHWNDGFSAYNSGLIVPNFQWTFVAVVVEPTKATLYMNAGSGMQTATNVATHTIRPLLNPGYIGWDQFSANRRWFGSIDEAMIFDRALTPAQMEALYSGTVIVPPTYLGIARSGDDITLSWPNGTLQQADEVNGTYQDMTGISSPHTLAPGGNRKFYRVMVQP